MRVVNILREKGEAVFTAPEGVTMREACRILSEKRVGAIVVVDAAGTAAGILSERDVIRALGEVGDSALDAPISAYMTREVVSCCYQDTVDGLMSVMTNRRIRHIPVIEEGRLRGLVSIGDVVKRRIAETELEAEALKAYIAAT